MCCVQDNQRDLEQATEQLSEYLERDITSEMLVDIKQKVQDKHRYVQTFHLLQNTVELQRVHRLKNLQCYITIFLNQERSQTTSISVILLGEVFKMKPSGKDHRPVERTSKFALS